MKPRKGRANYISREAAMGGGNLIDIRKLLTSSSRHDGEMIKKLRMLQILILCQSQGVQAVLELVEARVPQV